MRSFIVTLVAAAALTACLDAPPDSVDPEDVSIYFRSRQDNDPTTVMDDGKSDLPRYAIPSNLPELVNPEIIVSLDGLSVTKSCWPTWWSAESIAFLTWRAWRM